MGGCLQQALSDLSLLGEARRGLLTPTHPESAEEAPAGCYACVRSPRQAAAFPARPPSLPKVAGVTPNGLDP